jgi:hypothetical protein
MKGLLKLVEGGSDKEPWEAVFRVPQARHATRPEAVRVRLVVLRVWVGMCVCVCVCARARVFVRRRARCFAHVKDETCCGTSAALPRLVLCTPGCTHSIVDNRLSVSRLSCCRRREPEERVRNGRCGLT